MKILLAYGSGPSRIDDMKVFGGVSNGRTGQEILVNIPGSYAHEVRVLVNAKNPPGVWHSTQKFRTWDEYQDLLYRQCETWKPDIVLCAVAVSNFTPASIVQWSKEPTGATYHSLGPVKGKIDTRVIDRLTLEMVKTPSVIGGVRERIGRTATLVGFKLTSCGDKAECIEHARVVMRDAKCDLVVANDLKLGLDRKFFVTPVGVFEGLASELPSIAIRIAQAKQSGFYESYGRDTAREFLPAKTGKAWDTARELYPRIQPHLSRTPDGHLHGCFAVRHEKDGFVTTSRAKLVSDYIPLTHVERVCYHTKQVHHVHGRATLNAPLLAQMFEAHPETQTIIHLHRHLVGALTFSYIPAGTDAERFLGQTPFGVVPGDLDTYPAFNIMGHGSIMTFPHTDTAAIMAFVENTREWEEAP